MDNFNRIVTEFKEELEHQGARKQVLDEVTRDLAMEQEKINAQNRTNAKNALDLVNSQKDVEKIRLELKDREEQIVIKEKIIRTTTESLRNERERLLAKETELSKREKGVVENENKIKTIKADLEKNLAIVNAERSYDDTRKAKIKRKEEQIEEQLNRIRNINI